MPTSTPNVRNGCHPYSTKDVFENNYVVVHNGVVRNTSELQKQHESLGIEYVSMQEDGRFNDSEALTYDIARYLEGEVDKITAAGSIAFIAVKRDNQGKPVALFFGRNSGNPLKMKRTKHSLTLSSEGEGKDIEVNKLHCFIYETGELTTTTCIIPLGYSSSTYHHYTPPYHGSSRQSTYPYSDFDDEDDELGMWNNSFGISGTRADEAETLEKREREERINELQESLTPDIKPKDAIAIRREAAKIDNGEPDKFSLQEQEFVKNEAEMLLEDHDFDYQKAIVEVGVEMGKLNQSIREIDGLEAPSTLEVDRYCDYHDRLLLLREVAKYLSGGLKKSEEESKEGRGSKGPWGFHAITTDETHTKKLPATTPSRNRGVVPDTAKGGFRK